MEVACQQRGRGRPGLTGLMDYRTIDSLAGTRLHGNLKDRTMGLLSRWVTLLVPCLCWPLGMQAQDGPDRVLRLVVPFPPGAVVDISGRLLAGAPGRQLGVHLIVDNKVGAGGTLGAAAVARAPATGWIP